MSFASEFKSFAMKGSVVDLAVGVIIGGAFGKIVDSLVSDVIMPIVGKIFGGLDFGNYFIPLSGQTEATLIEAKKAGAVFGLRQLHHSRHQLRHSGDDHFHDGQGRQPSEGRACTHSGTYARARRTGRRHRAVA